MKIVVFEDNETAILEVKDWVNENGSKRNYKIEFDEQLSQPINLGNWLKRYREAENMKGEFLIILDLQLIDSKDIRDKIKATFNYIEADPNNEDFREFDGLALGEILIRKSKINKTLIYILSYRGAVGKYEETLNEIVVKIKKTNSIHVKGTTLGRGIANAKRQQVAQTLTEAVSFYEQAFGKTNYDELILELKQIKAGNQSAGKYHDFIIKALGAIFDQQLYHPVKEQKIYKGRKRIDIVFNNKGLQEGFFSELITKHQVKAPYVFFECKNYSQDLENPEFDQLSGRFSPRKGVFGIIVCRSNKNKNLMNEMCKDRLEKNEYILILDDNDIMNLLNFRKNNDFKAIDQYMENLFRELVM